MTDPRRDPERWKAIFEETTREYGLPRGLLEKVAEVESNFDPDAKSRAGAVGLMQIIPRWHPDVDPTDPVASIRYAGRYLSELKDRFGSWDLALAAYNAGPTNVRRFGGIPPFRETQDYVRRISQAVPFEPEERDASGLAAQIASRVVDPTQGRMMPDATRVSLAEQVEGRQGEEESQTFLNYVMGTIGRQTQELREGMRGSELDQQILESGASSFERFTDPSRRDNLPGPLAALMNFAESPAAIAVGMAGPFAAGKVTRAASPLIAGKGAQATPAFSGIVDASKMKGIEKADPHKANIFLAHNTSNNNTLIESTDIVGSTNRVIEFMNNPHSPDNSVVFTVNPSANQVSAFIKSENYFNFLQSHPKHILKLASDHGFDASKLKTVDLIGDLGPVDGINFDILQKTNPSAFQAPSSPLANQVKKNVTAPGTSVNVQANTVGPVVVPDVPDIMASARTRGVALKIPNDRIEARNALKTVPNPKYFPDDAPQVIQAQKAGYEVQGFHGTEYYTPFELTDDIWFGTHFGSPRSGIERIHAKSHGDDILGELKLMEGGRELTYRVGKNSRVLPVMLRGNEKNYLNMTDGGVNDIRSIIRESEDINHITYSQARDLRDKLNRGADYSEIYEELGKLLEPKGIYGVRYVNTLEDPGSISYMTFLPGSVRSLNANFTPSKAGEPGLMLGIGAFGAGLGASQFESSSFSDSVNRPDG